MDELVCGVFKPEAVAYHQQVIRRMKDEGCDAVVLGCTEIPRIVNEGNSPLPTLDSTRLLAWAALRLCKAPLLRHSYCVSVWIFALASDSIVFFISCWSVGSVATNSSARRKAATAFSFCSAAMYASPKLSAALADWG
jgi:hypothetical protein